MELIADRYHLLKAPLPGEWCDKLLGRVVADKENPTAKTAPSRDGPKGAEGDDKTAWVPQKIVPGLEGQPLKYTTLHQLLGSLRDIDASAKLTKYFEAQATLRRSTRVTIEGIEVERYDISNLEETLSDLMENTDYAESVRKILRANDGSILSLGMVSGIFVSKSLIIREERSKEAGVGGRAQIPMSTAVGDPTGTADVGGSAKYQETQDKEAEVKIDVLSVFAVAYTDVTLSPVAPKEPQGQATSRRWPRWKRKRNVAPVQEYKVEIDTSVGAKLYHDGRPDPLSTSGVKNRKSLDLNGTSTTGSRVDHELAPGGYTFTTADSVV